MAEIDVHEVQADEDDHSTGRPNSVAAPSDEDELRERNESQSFVSDEQKTFGTVVTSGSQKIVEATKQHGKSRQYSDDPEVQEIVIFLRSKDLSENLIGRVLKNGLWKNGFDRLLQALGITSKEMKKFHWKRRFDSSDFAYDSPESEVTPIQFAESSMSPDNFYLKNHFGDTLVRAIKEILKLKPNDPVDFLGNWLINYEVCKERENRREEFEAQLMAQRELSKVSEKDSESGIIGYDSQENYWSYGEHEDTEMQ